ncbi:MAG: cation:proton antiporter [Solirubrobacteraceae bacterium]
MEVFVMEPVQLAAILAGAVLVASMVSVEVGISVALIELAFGVVLGNILNLDPDASWLAFIAGFASVVLTFLAGAEVDPDDFRERFWPAIAIGVVSFAGPFVVAAGIALGPLGWTTKAALIAGTALSTTSLAVVYAVLVETVLNSVRVGKLIMSACFVTDMCTVIALSTIFIKPTVWFPVFLVASVLVVLLLPKIARWFFGRYGDRVIEPEIKLVFVLLLALMLLGDEANSQAVLPAFVLGLVMSRHYQRHQEEQRRLRVVAFAFLTPFLLLARRFERVTRSRVRQPWRARRIGRREDGAQADAHLPPRPAARPTPRRVHHAVDEHWTDVRHDQLPLWPERPHHRPHPVLAPRHRGRAVRDHPHRDSPTVVLTAHNRRPTAPPTPARSIGDPHPRVRPNWRAATKAKVTHESTQFRRLMVPTGRSDRRRAASYAAPRRARAPEEGDTRVFERSFGYSG